MHLQKHYRRPDHSTDGRRLAPAWRLFKLAQTNLEPFLPDFLDLDVRSALELCSKNMLAIEGAEFKDNPWSPVAAPILSLRRGEHQILDEFSIALARNRNRVCASLG